MSKTEYYYPKGGLPKRGKILIGQAVFKEAYAVIPREVMTDIVTSYFPNWEKTHDHRLTGGNTDEPELFH